MVKIDLIAGTRPNLVKIAVLEKELRKVDTVNLRIIYTAQHFASNMSDIFFEEFRIPNPYKTLNLKSLDYCDSTGSIFQEYEKFIRKDPADIVIVVGDVNSTLATAIVAKKFNKFLIHVESGLRSGDLSMPEEINRILTDRISDIHFVTSKTALKNLKNEGVCDKKIYFVGNVMIDTLMAYESSFLEPEWFSENGKENITLTLHRPANVDDVSKLLAFLHELTSGLPGYNFFFPVHPRLKHVFQHFDRKIPNLKILPALSYFDFQFLLKNSSFVVTDSGGVSEETTYYGVPCFTFRNSTERPETISEGSNKLVSSVSDLIQNVGELVLRTNKKKLPEFWDGRASSRIASVISQIIDKKFLF